MALGMMPPHWRDQSWEKTLSWGVLDWKCSDVWAELSPNWGKTGLRKASRTAILYILRGGFVGAWLWVLYSSADNNSPTGLEGGSHLPL